MKIYLLIPFAITISLCNAQSTILWGVTPGGGKTNDGTIFQFNSSGSFLKDNSFGGKIIGQDPSWGLVKASTGLIYGLTSSGGTYDSGTIFSYDITSGTETDLWDFGNGTDGQYPQGTLIEVGDTVLYGTTSYGGTHNGKGIIFSYSISSGKETDIHNFGNGTDGAKPIFTALIQASNGLLYGMTSSGGSRGLGTIFSYNIATDTEIDIHDFGSDTDGQGPSGSLIQASDTLLYGMTEAGGANNVGIIFSYDIFTGNEANLYDFDGTNGRNPFSSLIQVNDSLLYGMTIVGGSINKGTIFSYNVLRGKEIVIHNFGNGTDGQFPAASLLLASNGLLYGMTEEGGINDSGTIFSYNISSDSETDIHDFTGVDGDGTLFSYDINSGVESKLHDFTGTSDGSGPLGTLFKASNGMLYGTTHVGGAYNDGVLFSFSISSGQPNDVHDFGSGTDGATPMYGTLIQVGDSLLYSMTSAGGKYGGGTIFSYNIYTEKETDLHDFGNGSDGDQPQYSTLLNANNGLLYGMTYQGGDNDYGTFFSYDISTQKENIVYSFNLDNDSGAYPGNGVILASDGLLYGETDAGGGTTNTGTIFDYNTNSEVFTGAIAAFSFNGGYGDQNPVGDLVEADAATGINQLSAVNNHLSIYPNPTNGEINITSTKTINEIEVFNLLGQVIYKSPLGDLGVTNFKFQLNDNGMYFVTITSNNQTATSKVIVSK